MNPPPNFAEYRPCVGIALFNAEGKVFIGRRRGLADHETYAWQLPQGGIDKDEDPRLAARRELREETNIESVEFLMEAPDWLFYDLPAPMLRRSWRGRFRGQAQKWIAFRFTGDESEIDIDEPAGGEKPEFGAWRWEKLENTPALVIPFKRNVYVEMARIFAPLAKKS